MSSIIMLVRWCMCCGVPLVWDSVNGSNHDRFAVEYNVQIQIYPNFKIKHIKLIYINVKTCGDKRQHQSLQWDQPNHISQFSSL